MCLYPFSSHALEHAFFSLTHLCCSAGVHPASVSWSCCSSSSVWCRSFSLWRVSPRQCSLENGQVSWAFQVPGNDIYIGSAQIWLMGQHGAHTGVEIWAPREPDVFQVMHVPNSGISRSMQLLSKGIQTILVHHPIKIFFFLSCMELQNP